MAVIQAGSSGVINVSFKDDVGIITMRRGENRFNESFVEGMHAALDEVLRNPQARAVVTTGEGKFFSNGLDLPWLAYLGHTDAEKLNYFISRRYRSLFFRMLTFPLPTVALINGHSFAAGAMFALAHDHMIMQNNKGWWCMNEVHIKLRFHRSMIAYFKLRLSRPTFHEATVLGRRFTGDEAVKAGIAHESCPPKDLLHRAMSWIRKTSPPGGYDREHFQTVKEDVYAEVIALKYDKGDVPSSQFSSSMSKV